MSDVESAIANNASGDENNQNDKQSRGRKGKAAAKKETVAKGLGPEVLGDVEGRRRTRSATKGVTATPPPPAKKDRKSSNASSTASAGKPKGRGRPRKSAARGAEEDKSEADKDSSTNDSKDFKRNDLDEEMTDVSSADDNAKTACEKDKDKDKREDGTGDKKATNDDDDDDDDDDNDAIVTATVAGTATDKVTNVTEDSSEGAETIDIDQKKNVQENGDKSKSPAKMSTEEDSVKDDDIDDDEEEEEEKKKATDDKVADEISKMKQTTANNTTVTANAVMADQNSATDKSTE